MGRHQTRKAAKLVVEIDLQAGADVKEILLELAVFVGKNGVSRSFRRHGFASAGKLVASIKPSVAAMKPVFIDKTTRFAFTVEGTLNELWERNPARILKQYSVAVPEIVRPEHAGPGMSAGTWIYVFVAELVIPSHSDPYLRPGVPCLRLSGRRAKPNRPETKTNATPADLKRLDKELYSLIPYVGMTMDNEAVAKFFERVGDYTAPDEQTASS